MSTEYASILDRLTGGRSLPEGCDRWALKATGFDSTTRGGYRWVDGWNEADPGGREFSTGDPCPQFEGDGLCVGLTFAGLASGGQKALCLMLVAFASADVLGADANKVRVKRARVVERLSGEAVLRRHGAGANLSGADLRGADLRGANLRGAYLTGAYLTGANLTGANLRGADLGDAYLGDAYLGGAYLGGANLRGANLGGATLTRADLTRADLRGAYLGDARISALLDAGRGFIGAPIVAGGGS